MICVGVGGNSCELLDSERKLLGGRFLLGAKGGRFKFGRRSAGAVPYQSRDRSLGFAYELGFE